MCTFEFPLDQKNTHTHQKSKIVYVRPNDKIIKVSARVSALALNKKINIELIMRATYTQQQRHPSNEGRLESSDISAKNEHMKN